MDFQYKVRTAEGKVMTGVRESDSKASAIRELRERGYQPIVVMPLAGSFQAGRAAAGTKSASRGSFKLSLNMELTRSVKQEDVLVLTRDLLSIVHSGIPIITGLQDTAAQFKNTYLKGVLEKVVTDVSAGERLSSAFAKHPRIFSELYCSTLRAGETSGKLEEILERLVKSMERDIETSSTIKNAVRYPIIVLGFLAAAFILITVVVIPRIAGVFAQFKTELPLPTRILIWVGNFANNNAVGILAGAAAAAAALYFYRRTKQGRYVLDSICIRTPVFGPLFKKIEIAKFTSTLQSLYGSGMVLPEALDVCARVVNNAVLSRSIDRIAAALREGKRFSETIASIALFPPLVVRMISTGEKTGGLEPMLGEVTRHYDREVEYTTKSLTTLIEPILTVTLGCMVLVLALGVFLPMWNVLKLFRQGAGI